MKKDSSLYLMTTLFLLIFLSFSLVLANEIIPENSTLLLMHLNDNAFDDSDNVNHGVITGADCSTSGKYNQGCSFDGLNDYILVPHINEYENSVSTIAFSFKPSVINIKQGLITKDALYYSTGGHYAIRIRSDNSIEVALETKSITRYFRSNPGSVELDKWHDVVVQFGSEGFKLYVNGNLEKEDDYTGNTIGNKEPLVIGSSSHKSGALSHDPLVDFFSGVIDEISIWNRVLSQEEISVLNNNGDIVNDNPNQIDQNDDSDSEDENTNPETNETNDTELLSNEPVSSGSGGGSSGGGGGGGGSSTSSSSSTSSGGSTGCNTKWICSDWSECTSEGIQTRTCEKKYEHCRTREVKPFETQNCVSQNLTEENPSEFQEFISLAVEAVTNIRSDKRKTTGAMLALLIVLAGIFSMVWAKKK